jgi:hypothetical protein
MIGWKHILYFNLSALLMLVSVPPYPLTSQLLSLMRLVRKHTDQSSYLLIIRTISGKEQNLGRFEHADT